MADPSIILQFTDQFSNIVGRGLEFKRTHEILKSTNKDLGLLVKEIEQHVKEDDLQNDEIEQLKKIMPANQQVLDKYKIRWRNFFLAPYYQRKLDAKYQSLQRYSSIQMQVQISRDLKKLLSKMSSGGNSSLRSQSISFRGFERIRTQTLKGNLEIFPEFTVGLDGPFMKDLKSELLHGDEQILNLHGLPGSGKTTLAKKLYHDPQVKVNRHTCLFSYVLRFLVSCQEYVLDVRL